MQERLGNDDLMTLHEAANELGADIATVQEYVDAKRLKAVVHPHVVHIRRASLEQLKKEIKPK